MANVLTDLAADAYKAADVVSRELVGFASSVTMNSDTSERLAVGQVCRSPFAPDATATNISPSMTIPEGTDQTISNKTLSISKQRAVQIPWTGEDMKFVNQGAGFETVYGGQIAQAMRTLANEVESDIADAIGIAGSRAAGTAGTTPFGSNFNTVAETRQILVDNGCPMSEVTLVIDTLAGTKLRNLAQLQKANENGSDAMLRQGVLLDLQGMAIKESGNVYSHTAGTGASATTDNAGYSIGDTVITLASAGTGTILEGDVITFAGDSNQYVVASGDADVSNGGTITLQEPGLRQAIAASTTAITVVAASTRNAAFTRSAVELAMRAPAVPDGGDAADDAMLIQDPRSGLIFEIRSYKGYRKAMFEVAACWGQTVWKDEHVALLLG